jgi:succinate dehydrogenase hydrophobic anchor subunit
MYYKQVQYNMTADEFIKISASRSRPAIASLSVDPSGGDNRDTKARAQRESRSAERPSTQKLHRLKRRDTLTHWLIQRGTASILAPTILLANVSTLICLNILLFWHFHVGIREILADYVHHEVTRDLILVLLRILIIIEMKYAFVFFVL